MYSKVLHSARVWCRHKLTLFGFAFIDSCNLWALLFDLRSLLFDLRSHNSVLIDFNSFWSAACLAEDLVAVLYNLWLNIL